MGGKGCQGTGGKAGDVNPCAEGGWRAALGLAALGKGWALPFDVLNATLRGKVGEERHRVRWGGRGDVRVRRFGLRQPVHLLPEIVD